MSSADKWNKRYRMAPSDSPAASHVLQQHLHLLPASGRSLDLAAGRGGNTLLLAQQGWESHAWDISGVAMSHLAEEALRRSLTVHCQTRDVSVLPPVPQSFDLIVVSRFLERNLCPAISEALTPGGLLFYQTFTADSRGGPTNPAYRLQRNELLRLFPALQIVYYSEEGILLQGSEAMLIARRPRESPITPETIR